MAPKGKEKCQKKQQVNTDAYIVMENALQTLLMAFKFGVKNAKSFINALKR